MTSKLGFEDAAKRLTVKSGHFEGRFGRIVARLLCDVGNCTRVGVLWEEKGESEKVI